MTSGMRQRIAALTLAIVLLAADAALASQDREHRLEPPAA